MIALLASLVAHAEPAPVLSAELRSLMAIRADGGPRTNAQARLIARPGVRVVLDVTGGFTLGGPGVIRAALGTWRSADVPWDALLSLARDPRVRRIELGPSLGTTPPVDHSAELTGVDVLRTRTGSPLDGRGVLVVDFDTGVDLGASQVVRADGGLHPFVDVDGDGLLTRGTDTVVVDGEAVPIGVIDATIYDAHGEEESRSFGYRQVRVDPEVDILYADLDGDGERQPKEPRYLGEDLDRSGGIEAGEELVGLSTTKIAATWDAGRGLTLRDEGLAGSSADTYGHGISVASVLLAGQPGLTRWAGHAPGVDLAAFSYTEAWEEFDWVTAIDAALGLDPDVLLFEVGDFTAQFADGSSSFEQALVAAADRGTVNVCPSGNVGAYGKHGQHRVPATGEYAGIYVWEGYGVRYVGATLVTRDGPIDEVAFQDGTTGAEVSVPIDGGLVELGGFALRATSDRSDRGTRMVYVEWYTTTGAPIEGVHFLRVDPAVASDVHLWLYDDATSWSGGAVNFDPSWGADAAYSWATAESSAVVPSTSDACVTLGSYQARADVYAFDETPIAAGELSAFSGQGPRIDGAPVVDVVAPGHYDIRALGSSEFLPDNSWTLFSGTSAAGPHVAAAAAILKQVAPDASHDEIEEALAASADRTTIGVGGDYDDAWGSGRLQIPAAVAALDQSGPRFAVWSTQSRWSPLFQLRVTADEPLDGAPTCVTSAGEVALVEVGPGVWQGSSPAGDVSCEGRDASGNRGTKSVVW